MSADRKVPADFPREPIAASVAGTQMKSPFRRLAEECRAGPPESELLERYEACEDLAVKLARYCTHKASKSPSLTREDNLARVEISIVKKVELGVWVVSAAERRWVMNRTRKLLGW